MLQTLRGCYLAKSLKNATLQPHQGKELKKQILLPSVVKLGVRYTYIQSSGTYIVGGLVSVTVGLSVGVRVLVGVNVGMIDTVDVVEPELVAVL